MFRTFCQFAACFLGLLLLATVPRPCLAADEDEAFNAFGQLTYIWHEKRPFSAAYTNLNGTPNSLVAEKERSWTTTATAYLGLRLWSGGEVYFVPEVISELPLSGLHGLGGSIQNGELEKNGLRTPTIYRSRLFLRQTWDLGGETTRAESGPMQLAGSQSSRRFVLTAGNLSVIDVFDRNAYAGDVRQQFLNMSFLTYAAFDFAADARGYSWGIAGEFYDDEWVVRGGRFIGPVNPNQLELEHRHDWNGRPGKLRVLAYRNVENMGRFDDAVSALASDPAKNATTCTGFNYGSGNAGAPDLCWARRRNTKLGAGASFEQAIGANGGMFGRAMWSDGRTEVFAYTATDRSLSFGANLKGENWGRPLDTVGIGYSQGWLSASHVRYLGLGGIDGFIGDGRINYAPEKLGEIYYSAKANRFLWLTADLQRVVNPAYNADRGPVTLWGIRLHAEF
jgi:hypothetical protein